MPLELPLHLEIPVRDYISASESAWRVVSNAEALLLQFPHSPFEGRRAVAGAAEILKNNDNRVKELVKKRQNVLYNILNSNSRDIVDIANFLEEVQRLINTVTEHTMNGLTSAGGTILQPSDATVRFGFGPSEVRNVGPGLPDQWITHTHSAEIVSSMWSSVLKGKLVLLHNGSLQDVAIKKIIYRGVDDNTRLRRIRRERGIWRKLDSYHHPNILPYYGTYSHRDEINLPEEQRMVYLVSPLANGGDLYDYIDKQVNEPNDIRFKLLGDIIMGLELLHTGKRPYGTVEEGQEETPTQIYHGNISPGNILLHLPTPDKPIAWLSDFAISVDSDRAPDHLAHQDFRAPELRPFTPVPENITPEERKARDAEVLPLLEKGDVFSFGCTAYCLLTQHQERFNYNLVLRWVQPKDISEGLYKLIQQCCDEDCDVRPTVAEIRSRCNELEVRFEDAENRKALGLHEG